MVDEPADSGLARAFCTPDLNQGQPGSMSEAARTLSGMSYFAVTMVHGPRWDSARGIREQDGWDEHAAFMDRLVDEGFVVLGGPVGDGQQGAMLLVEAMDAAGAASHLAADPWAAMGILHAGSVQPWALWLDGRNRTA